MGRNLTWCEYKISTRRFSKLLDLCEQWSWFSRRTATGRVTVCTLSYRTEESYSHIWEWSDLHFCPQTSVSAAPRGHSEEQSSAHTRQQTVTTELFILILAEDTNLYPGVNIIDFRDAAKYGLHFFLGQDGSAHLPFFFQWKLEQL